MTARPGPVAPLLILVPLAAAVLSACGTARSLPTGRVDGLPVERFDEYAAGSEPPPPWRTAAADDGQVRLALDPAAESPFVANRITGKGVVLEDRSPSAGAGAGLACRFPAPPDGPLYLGFDARCDGLDLVCELAGDDGRELALTLRGDGGIAVEAPGMAMAEARLPKPGWAHLALTIGADGALRVSAVQGSSQDRPVLLAEARLARPPHPTALRFISAGDAARTGRWMLDNICMAGDVNADRRGLWPFDQAPLHELRASPRKVFAYYYPIYGAGPGIEDPGLSWYQRTRLNPSWAADHRADRAMAGAELLYTPLPRPPLPAGTSAAQAQAISAESEVQLARQLGLDGFLLDFHAYPRDTGGEPTFQARSFAILDAAARLDPGFRIIPAVYSDAGRSGIEGEADAGRTPAEYASSPVLRRLADHPGVLHLPDGRMALSMWLSECHSAAWWRETMRELEARGIRVAIYPQFNSYGHLADFAPFASGMNHWGPRTPERYGFIAAARPLTATVIQPICFQDVRTRGATYWESQASRTFRGLWEQAIGERADWAFIHTWSDYSEQAQAPSTAIGFAIHDLNAYFIQWFKLGAPPEVRRDALYYVHRRSHSSVQPAHGAVWRIPGNGAAVDVIEVLAFLTRPADITVDTGGTPEVRHAGAGLSTFTVPLPAGRSFTPAFSAVRDGVAVLRGASRYSVLAGVEFQDPLYHAGSIHGIEEAP